MIVYKCSSSEIELEFNSSDGALSISVILSNKEAEKKAKEILSQVQREKVER